MPWSRRSIISFGYVLLIVSASPAAAKSRSDLLRRLPKAYETYRDQLRKEGRGNELTMSADQKLDALDMWYELPDSNSTGAVLRWFGPKDSTWIQVNRMVTFPGSGLTGSFPGKVGGEDLDPKLPSRDENEDCQNFVAARFQIASHESLLFTMGHVMEGCSDIPWMVIRLGKKDSRYLLPDLFVYNAQALWSTDSYLILNIKVEYEYGSTYEGLAFWDLEKGWIHSIVSETHVGSTWGDEPPRSDSTEGLGVLLRDLASARVGEVDRIVYVDTGKAKLVFWPEAQEWMASR